MRGQPRRPHASLSWHGRATTGGKDALPRPPQTAPKEHQPQKRHMWLNWYGTTRRPRVPGEGAPWSAGSAGARGGLGGSFCQVRLGVVGVLTRETPRSLHSGTTMGVPGLLATRGFQAAVDPSPGRLPPVLMNTAYSRERATPNVASKRHRDSTRVQSHALPRQPDRPARQHPLAKPRGWTAGWAPAAPLAAGLIRTTR